jgi:outer membrane protein OmpA-like peptidoglycan-associated protein
MKIGERQADPRGARVCVQGRLLHGWRACATLPALVLLLAGCSTMSSLNPVNWWHSYEGGKIAEQRPPLPGSDAADPNLGSVPARPAPPDRDAMKRLTQGLVADRENARYSNAANPLADPSSPNASPSLFGSGTLPPPVKPAAPAAASASLQAASAPPEPPAAPPSAAPRKAVQAAPLDPPAAAATVPALPIEPPARSNAAPVPVAPVAASTQPLAAAQAAIGPNDTVVAFDPGSSLLTPSAADAVKQLAMRRKGTAIALTGYGDATSSDPSAQAAAMGLAVARTKAISSALQAAGVPAGAIQMGAEAAGRGVLIRLLQ